MLTVTNLAFDAAVKIGLLFLAVGPLPVAIWLAVAIGWGVSLAIVQVRLVRRRIDTQGRYPLLSFNIINLA